MGTRVKFEIMTVFYVSGFLQFLSLECSSLEIVCVGCHEGNTPGFPCDKYSGAYCKYRQIQMNCPSLCGVF